MSQPVSTKTQEMATQMPPPANTPKKSTWRNTVVEVVSGGTGGAIAIAACTPLMYLKMYMQEKARNPQNPSAFQKNPVKWFSGAPGLAGWMFPQAAFTFTMYGWMTVKLCNHGERELTSLEKLFYSCATGAATTVFVAPQELIWTQQKKAEEKRQKMLEEQKLDPKSVPTKSATQVAKEVWKAHGLKGFFRGGMETLGREIVSTSVLTALAGQYPILAPVVGATVSQPLDGRKTNKQADFTYKAPMKELFMVKAFSGLAARTAIYLVFMNVAPYVKDQMKAAFKE